MKMHVGISACVIFIQYQRVTDGQTERHAIKSWFKLLQYLHSYTMLTCCKKESSNLVYSILFW